MIVEAMVTLFNMITGKTPRFRVDGGTPAENLALQNIQVKEEKAARKGRGGRTGGWGLGGGGARKGVGGKRAGGGGGGRKGCVAGAWWDRRGGARKDVRDGG